MSGSLAQVQIHFQFMGIHGAQIVLLLLRLLRSLLLFQNGT